MPLSVWSCPCNHHRRGLRARRERGPFLNPLRSLGEVTAPLSLADRELKIPRGQQEPPFSRPAGSDVPGFTRAGGVRPCPRSQAAFPTGPAVKEPCGPSLPASEMQRTALFLCHPPGRRRGEPGSAEGAPCRTQKTEAKKQKAKKKRGGAIPSPWKETCPQLPPPENAKSEFLLRRG